MSTLLRLAGYDTAVLARGNVPGLRLLSISNAWVLGGMTGGAMAAGYLVWLGGGGWLPSVLALCTVLVSLLALQAFVLSATALSEVDRGPNPAVQRAARRWGSCLLVALLLVLTQPWLVPLMTKPTGPATQSSDAWRDKIAKQQDEAARDALGTEQRQVEALLKLARDIAEADTRKDVEDQDTGSSSPSQTVTAASSDKPRKREEVSAAPAPPPAPRKALLIGNDQYTGQPRLSGAVRDVRDIEKELTRLGFKVTVVTDGKRRDMEMAVDAYARELKAGDISLFHYSGHGFQARGANYLVPVDFAGNPMDLRTGAVSVNLVVQTLSRRRPLVNVFAIDACRSTLDGAPESGLAPIEAGANTYVALAAKPGQVAVEVGGADGRKSGLFSSALVRNLSRPVDIDTVFRAVRAEVASGSAKVMPRQPVQETWSSHNLTVSVVLATGVPVASLEAVTTDLGGGTIVAPQGGSPVAGTSAGALALPPLRLADGRTVCDVGLPQPGPYAALQRRGYEQCLEARKLQLADDLAAPTPSEPVAATVASKRRNSLTAWDRYRDAWTRPYKAAWWTALLLFATAGGLWWRHGLRRTHELYVDALHGQHRALVLEKAEAAWTAARQMPHAFDDDQLRRRFLARLDPPFKPHSLLTLDPVQVFNWLLAQPVARRTGRVE